jgi:hypothetical protein
VPAYACPGLRIRLVRRIVLIGGGFGHRIRTSVPGCPLAGSFLPDHRKASGEEIFDSVLHPNQFVNRFLHLGETLWKNRANYRASCTTVLHRRFRWEQGASVP